MYRLSVLFALAVLVGPSIAQVAPATSADPLSARPRARCGSRTVRDVAFERYVSVAGMTACAATNAAPWSVRIAPDESSYYVSLFGGGLGADNCQVAHFDLATHDLLDVIPVGASPEEIVFTVDPSGALLHGYVSNSSDSSISVFDASGEIVTTIALPVQPGAPYPTAFPFGLAVGPQQERVYVSTLDDSGRIFVIDTLTQSLLPRATIELGARHNGARLLVAGTTLIVPVTVSHAGFQGSTAKLAFIDTVNQTHSMLTLASSPNFNAFPSPQDLAVLCETKLFVAGFDLGARVLVFDIPSRTLVNTIRTNTSQPQGKFQALGVSASGLLAVADFWTSEIAYIDGWTEQWIRTQPASAQPLLDQPNELTFTPDGQWLLVPALTSDLIGIYQAN